MRIDAHLHQWDLSLGVYDWLGPEHGALYDDYGPQVAADRMAASGVDAAVLVQAADDVRDTRAMLDVAAEHPWVAGVVGWVDLERPDDVDASLAALDAGDLLCGVRQLVHDDPRRDVLGLPAVTRTAGALAAHGLVMDVPDAWPAQIDGALALARAVPELTLVLDHLGKPPWDSEQMEPWGQRIRDLAALPNVVAKVSGLQSPGRPFDAASLRPAWDLALESFGTGRLMFGSDWPMTVTGPGYEGVVEVVSDLAQELSGSEQDDLWWRTCARTYHRSVPAATD